jgi:hypothetical protein
MTAVLITIIVVGTVALALAVDVAVLIAWLRKRTAPAWESEGRSLTTARFDPWVRIMRTHTTGVRKRK